MPLSLQTNFLPDEYTTCICEEPDKAAVDNPMMQFIMGSEIMTRHLEVRRSNRTNCNSF